MNSDTANTPIETECIRWLGECMGAFPRLKKYSISCEYAIIPNNTLGKVTGTVTIKRNVDPEAVLLEGKSSARISRKTGGEFKIRINTNMRKIRNPLLRKQVVQHTLTHELVHIENRDLVTLSKDYSRRKQKRIHKKEFGEKVHQKFNEIRATAGMPPVKSMADVEAAIGKILSEIGFG